MGFLNQIDCYKFVSDGKQIFPDVLIVYNFFKLRSKKENC